MSVLTEFAMFPTDKGISVSPFVSKIIKMIRDSGYNYQLTAMGTLFETNTFGEALELINKAYNQLENDSERVYSTVKFDIQKSKNDRLSSKIKSIENKIGEVNK